MSFDAVRSVLATQYDEPAWVPGSGMTTEELTAKAEALEKQFPNAVQLRSNLFALICNQAQLAIDKEDIFQDKFAGCNIMRKIRVRQEKAIKEQYLQEEVAQITDAWGKYGTYKANSDYSHTSPNTRALMQLGFSGLRRRVQAAAGREGLREKQQAFYQSCDVMLTAMCTAAQRLADAIRPYNTENALALEHLAQGAPQNIYEAMQLLILYFYLHDYVAGTRVRTLGRLDVLLTPFYQQDIARGTFTKDQIKEMLKFFLHKIWSAKVPYDLPFCLCGLDETGRDVSNEVTELILETYNELNIYSPKIHIRVNKQTPPAVIRQVLSYIRGGNSSFVFVNDDTAIRGLTAVGIRETDAWDYVPIGCYEPAVWGMELGCTGCGGINLAKAVELVFTQGVDLPSGEMCGLDTGVITSFEGFKEAVKQQIAYQTRQATGYVAKIEPYYGTVNPDPILSSQYDHCMETGVDIYDGGALYNNSSMSFYCIASLADALCAVKALVFDEKRFTFSQLAEILKNDWKGHEDAQAYALGLPHKYGNNDPQADGIAAEFAHYCADLVNNKPNGRGGVFKAAIYTIDHCFKMGEKTGATADGRNAGQPLSKNLCATTGMDRKGITGLIHSAGKIDAWRFPNGSVLDIVLHPSAVSGEEGLMAFYGILLTYFQKGGLAMHGNVFHAQDLKKAQENPQQYKNLQVRVCGWNAYFINLTKAEQDAFIKQAENAV